MPLASISAHWLADWGLPSVPDLNPHRVTYVESASVEGQERSMAVYVESAGVAHQEAAAIVIVERTRTEVHV